jgi:hypothetical protein
MMTSVYAGDMPQAMEISPAPALSLERDSSHIALRQFKKSEISSYQKDRDFRYRDAGPEETGIMSLISYYIERFLHRLFTSHVGGTSVYSIILYVLMIFGVVMLIFHFFKMSPQSLLQRSSTSIAVESIDGDNIHENDFDRLIHQSVSQENYRLAVRFLYLKMLKILSDAELIRWEISKTNYDYYYELKQQSLRDEFLSLTSTFENSWYGNHDISTERYDEARNSFTLFFTTLNNRAK